MHTGMDEPPGRGCACTQAQALSWQIWQIMKYLAHICGCTAYTARRRASSLFVGPLGPRTHRTPMVITPGCDLRRRQRPMDVS
jgi:hypothetical protein